MAIQLTAFGTDPHWEGNTWSVADVDNLARWVAWVAIGQSAHVSSILNAVTPQPLETNKDAIGGAVSLLEPGAINNDHRDGWLFQVMSWLAAHHHTPGGLMNEPHLIHAHKGFDGLQILLDGQNAVQATIIFEDKATTQPRKTIREKVWPEFLSLEQGLAVNRLTQEATAILKSAGIPNAPQAVAKIVWKSTRRYRVSITADKSTSTSRASLFKGYEVTVPGERARRRAEVFEVLDLRDWMNDLAAKATQHALSMTPPSP